MRTTLFILSLQESCDLQARPVGCTMTVLKAKGAETWGVLLFVVDTLRKYASRLDETAGPKFLAAGQHLIDLVHTMRAEPYRMSTNGIQRMFNSVKAYTRLTEDLVPYIPKNHMLFHMICKAHEQGNPKFYSSFEDESLNKLLKTTCRYCSQAQFERGVLHRMRYMLDKQNAKRKRNEDEGDG